MLTLTEARAQLNDAQNQIDSTELQAYVDAVSAVVERQTGEVVDPRTVEEIHYVSGCELLLRSIPVIDVISVESEDFTWNPSTLTVDSQTGRVATTERLFNGRITVMVEAGFEQIPPNYNLAARIILQHLWEVQRGPSLQSLSQGTSVTQPGAGFAVPRRALELLGSPLPGIA